MVSVFDLDKLRSLLQDFYEICRIRITVFDETLSELVSYPPEVAPYCEIIRETPEGYAACMRCDREACAAAAARHSTHIYRCHAGLTEAVTPLYVGDVLAGYLLFGHVLSYASHAEAWTAVESSCAAIPADLERLRRAILDAPLIRQSYVRSAAQILNAVASYLILERMATLREDPLAARLDAYLTAHFTEKLNAAGIARTLGIGRTQLYELSRQLYGCGIAAHIRALRMERAKALLRDRPALPLAEAAALCGYMDYNYFITVFTRENGCTPGRWREESRNEG